MAKRLGKGLNALISETDLGKDESLIEEININECRPNPYQPRKAFDADALEELKVSIEEYGIVQPLIVRKSIKGYEIVAGERRFRAAKEANLKTVPAIVKEYNDQEMMEIALLENLQREDLTIIEEAVAYKSLIKELKLTQEELSQKLGKSRSHIANTMRLLSLPDDVIAHLSSGELSMGHGRALLGLQNEEDIKQVVKEILTNGLNVREVEQLIAQMNKHPKKSKRRAAVKKEDIFLKEQALRLREALGTNVKIQQGKEKGKIEIEFYSTEDLEKIIELLKQ